MVASAHHHTRLAMMLSASVAAAGVSGLPLSSASAAPITPFLAPAPVQHREDAGIVRAKAATPLGRCLATWNNTSGMSKREWKQTCKRVVKQNPGLYSKPF